MNRDESAKIQLTEAHKYVQQFLTIRITLFGSYVAFLGVLITAALKVEPVEKRFLIWLFVALVHLLAIMSLASATRAIWLFCAHMLLHELDCHGPGGNHQWLLANLRDRKYSSSYGIYTATLVLIAATWILIALDLALSTQVYSGQFWMLILITAVVWIGLAWHASQALEPHRMLVNAVDQALETQATIAQIQALSDEDLNHACRDSEDDAARSDLHWAKPVMRLVAWHRQHAGHAS